MKIVRRICATLAVRERVGGSRSRLYKVALAWTGDRMLADDLVQEAIAIGLDKGHQLRDPDKLYPWLYSILSNCWRRHLRSRQPDYGCEPDTLACGTSLEQQVERQRIVQDVRQAVFRLPLGQREVISLVDLEGFSYAEVAEILEIPIGTVMSRLNRARKALQQALRRMNPEVEPDLALLRRVR
ncbi:MAG TPA: RNA polymerase sigma factor [Thiohalobacter sp.]|nr:RNA polymerase sigma factor [Thiohalobacter sp.]